MSGCLCYMSMSSRCYMKTSLKWCQWLSFLNISAGAVQLERAGESSCMDRAHSPCCANGPVPSAAGHYVSVHGARKLIWSNTPALASSEKVRCLLIWAQPLAVLQQPPSDAEGVLLPAATPPEDHRCRVGCPHCEGRPGRFSIYALAISNAFIIRKQSPH